MPRTRTSIQRDDKIDQILSSAEARLESGGYEALTMAGVARDLGLAQAAIYWYFPSRDHLFVAAMQRKLSKILAKKSSKALDTKGSILWFAEQLSGLTRFRPAIQERAARSEVVARFVKEFGEMLRTMLRGALGPQVPQEQLELSVESFIAAVEGTLVVPMSAKQRREVLGFTLDKLIG